MSAGLVMALIDQVKENGQRVTVPVDLLETLLITAEQALVGQGMDRTGSQSPGAGKRNAPPGGYSKSAGITEKLTADRPATRRGDITRTETIMMKKETP
ncbi:Protein of uncharacterised function (DUF1380) [Klebsiella pneumoniae]|nr:Protein of uncharacterised function (DUF1380) [Klebsiella pneumoniae]